MERLTKMSDVILVSGAQGCGKTTLYEEFCSHGVFIYKDVDEFLPMTGFKERLDAFINEHTPYGRIVVLFGTFCEQASVEHYFPPAETRYWMDTPLDVCIERAIDRQLRAYTGDTLKKRLESMSEQEANEWLSDYFNPHNRRREAEAQYQLCMQAGFQPISKEDLMHKLGHIHDLIL